MTAATEYADRKGGLVLALVLSLVSCFWAGLLSAQQVVRGPYLQLGTPTSIEIRWRTDLPTTSRVRYGASPGNLLQSVQDTVATTEHRLTLTGLTPDTKYFYAVGTATTVLAGDDAQHFFVTSPLPGTARPVRIWILGDSGTKDNNARAVRDAYYEFTGERHTDLWLMLGDNAYNAGSDAEYQAAVFENMYEQMLIKSVLWPTLGNHDDNSASVPGPYPYYDIFSLPTAGEAGGMPSGTEAYYSFDYANIHFVCLNSTEGSLRDVNSPMWVWLEEDLAANTQDWTIAFWHHPPYSKGSHNSNKERELIQMRERALPILEAYGVDLVLSGHSHSYERSFLVDQHYGKEHTLADSMIIDGGDGRPDGDGAYHKPTAGPAPHEGAVYLVAGSSGQTSPHSGLNHPIMVTGLKVLGSVALDIAGLRLDATFIDTAGTVLDYFTILKGPLAAEVVKVSGDLQTGPAGATLPAPFVVQVRDANNQPVPGAQVDFRILTGYGTLSTTRDFTDAGGLAQTTLTFGATADTVQVEAASPGLPPVVFTAVAQGEAPQAVVTSDTLDFGEVTLGDSSAAFVAVRNTGTASLAVSQITLSGSDADAFDVITGAAPFTLAPGDSMSIGVRFRPASAGTKTATLSLISDDPNRPQIHVTLTGTAVAPAPQLRALPPSLDFGEVYVDSTVAQALQLTNPGTADLVITAVSLTGADSTQFSVAGVTVPLTVPPGDTSGFSVAFTPNSEGNKRAAVRLASNADTTEIALSGHGVVLTSDVTVSPVISLPATVGDADDPAIWIHPDDPSRSVVIGTDKSGSLYVWSLDGQELQVLPQNTKVNNVDARQAVRWGDEIADLVVTNLRNAGKLAVFKVNPDYANGDVLIPLADVNSANNDIQKDSYGICLYKRPADSTLFVIERPKNRGALRQYRVEPDGTGGVLVTPVRDLEYNGAIAEGFVADDVLGFLYVAEEDSGIHKYYADPAMSPAPIAFFATGDGIVPDREGLALYACDDSTGYLVLSSQGNSSIKIYDRGGDNRFLKTVVALDEAGNADLGTDGLDVTSYAGPPNLPNGFLVVHDQSGQRFHLYDWAQIAEDDLTVCVDGRVDRPQPRFTVAPDSLDFGEVRLDSSAERSLTLFNRGRALLRVTALTVAGDNASDFSVAGVTLPLELAPEDSARIGVRFSPERAGEKLAQLRFESNDPARATFQVWLRGFARDVTVSVEPAPGASLPKVFALKPSYPNPFNAGTNIEYALPVDSDVDLAIFDLLGQPVRRLVRQRQAAGAYRVRWDGRNDQGSAVGSGIYFVQFQAGGKAFVQKITLLK